MSTLVRRDAQSFHQRVKSCALHPESSGGICGPPMIQFVSLERMTVGSGVSIKNICHAQRGGKTHQRTSARSSSLQKTLSDECMIARPGPAASLVVRRHSGSRLLSRYDAPITERWPHLDVPEARFTQHLRYLLPGILFALCPSEHDHTERRYGEWSRLLIVIEHLMNENVTSRPQTLEALPSKEATFLRCPVMIGSLNRNERRPVGKDLSTCLPRAPGRVFLGRNQR